MNTLSIVLRQFTFISGSEYTSFLEHHDKKSVELAEQLPLLYCIIFLRKRKTNKMPIGGFFFKTNLSHEDPGFPALVTQVATTIQPSSSHSSNSKSFKPLPIKLIGDGLPNELEMDQFALDQYLKLATLGHS